MKGFNWTSRSWDVIGIDWLELPDVEVFGVAITVGCTRFEGHTGSVKQFFFAESALIP